MNAQEKRNFMKSYRVRAGLSQEQAAEILGVSRNTLVYYEQYPYSMSLEAWVKMCEAYGEEFSVNFIAQKLYEK